jgi:hypothetical protein
MTISSNNRKAGPYVGNGTASVFPFAFKIFQASDLEVVRLNVSTSVETILELTTDYTVTLNSDQDSNPGGSITLVAGALASGFNLVITSDLENLQPTDLTNQGGFYPDVINDALDRATIQIQQLQEQTDRAIKVPITNPTSIAELTADLIRLADSADNIDLVANDLTNVDIVATNIADVNTVADDIANVNATGSNIAAVVTVANDLNEPVSEIETVAGSIANVNTVGNNITNVNTTAANIANVNAVGSDLLEPVSEINTVAVNIANVNTVGTNIADVNTVASNIADVVAVGDNIADVVIAADNVVDITNFADVYQGGKAADPTLRNNGSALQVGDMYFNTSVNELRLYSGTSWIAGTAGTLAVQRFSGTGSATAFTLSTAPSGENNTQVYINGVYQQKDTYGVTGVTLTFSAAPPAGTDNIEVITISTLALGETTASLVSITDSGNYYSSGNVEGALQEAAQATTTKFLQAGTGAVSRTVQSRMREWVSVKDFGAVGDGSTDDTAAIQAAINYCTNLSNRKQTLYFPANNAAAVYKVTAPLVITSRLNIVGDGQFSTSIYGFGMSVGQFIIDWNCLAIDVVYHSGISNITIGSNNGAPTGVRLKNISYMLMKQVYLPNLYTGIYITGTGCFSNFFEEVTCYNIGYASVEWDTFTGGGHYMFSGCTFNGLYGVLLRDNAYTDSLAFYDCNWEQCVSIDLYVLGRVSGLTVNTCRSEGLNGLQSFRIEPAAGNSVKGLNITGCCWESDSGNADPIFIGGDVQGFSITGNSAGYIGFNQFVNLNGAGEAGVIAGNYCQYSPKVVSATRLGITVTNNRNSSGALADYYGTAAWGVVEGAFTFADASGAGLTFVVNSAKYTKIGRMVWWQAVIQYPTTSSGASAEISGLPYAVSGSSSATRAGARVDITDYVGAIYPMQGYSTNTRIGFFYNAGNMLANSSLSGKTMYMSGTYTV